MIILYLKTNLKISSKSQDVTVEVNKKKTGKRHKHTFGLVELCLKCHLKLLNQELCPTVRHGTEVDAIPPLTIYFRAAPDSAAILISVYILREP